MHRIIKAYKKHSVLIYAFILILISILLRFYNLNWDNGNYFHPDERNIANAVSKIHFFSQLDPQFFAYGGFPIYLYRLAADLLFALTHNNDWIGNWGNFNLIGRFFSAFFSTFTIIPLYFLAKKIANKAVALLTITLFTFTVASIQTAHYAVTESLITFIGVLICLYSIILLKRIKLKYSLLLGIMFGFGIASKTSAFSFLIMPLFAYFLCIKQQQLKIIGLIFNVIIFAASGFIIFTIFSPYTFLSFSKFLESMRYESGVATGSLPVVYTLQFNHTIPYLFQIYNLFWQIGIATIFCLMGFVFLIYKFIATRKRGLLIFLIFPLCYFLYVGSWHTKFVRYMLPIIPFLLVSASIFLEEIRSKIKFIGNTLIIFTLLTTIFWSLSFFTIYLRPQTRIQASNWIYDNIPGGAHILNEQWDDGLPIPIVQFNPSQFQITSLAMYDQDGPAKIRYLATNLNNADYLIFNSRRLYGTLIKLTDQYPITSNYYKLLFAQRLGYVQKNSFSSYPSLLGLTINDDASEETFQVYDHPKVIIFKNEKKYSITQLINIMTN